MVPGPPARLSRNSQAAGSVSLLKGPSKRMTTESHSKPMRRTFFVADLKCYMCGGVVGSIESEQPLTSTVASRTDGHVLLRQPGRDQAVELANWRLQRC